MSITYEIPGCYINLILPFTVKPKKAPKFSKGHVYSVNKDEETSIQLLARNYMRRNQLNIITRPCEVYLTIGFKLPIKLKNMTYLPKMDKVPDADNLAKQILDGIKKVCIFDDRIVYKLTVEKVYAETEFTQISIKQH
jgi:Holliday junction resolvase RusA-like endonuclease